MNLHTTQEELEEIKRHEAVCIHEYHYENAESSAMIYRCGTLEEMEAEANRRQTLAVPTVVKSLTARALLVSELGIN